MAPLTGHEACRGSPTRSRGGRGSSVHITNSFGGVKRNIGRFYSILSDFYKVFVGGRLSTYFPGGEPEKKLIDGHGNL